MESHQIVIEHFKLMEEIAAQLEVMPAQILEHTYHYEAFGSWYLEILKSGNRYRVVWDGKEDFLDFDKAELTPDRKRVVKWMEVTHKHLPSATSNIYLEATVSFFKTH